MSINQVSESAGWRRGITVTEALTPLRNIGGFFAFSLDVFVAMLRPPFAWREFLEQRNLST